MNAAIPVRRTSVSRPGVGVLVTVGITCLGVAFNLSRLALGLDRGPIEASVVAFVLLAAAGAALGFALRLRLAGMGLGRPLMARSIAGGMMAFAVLGGAAWASTAGVRVPSITQFGAGLLLFGLGTAPAEELLFRGVLYRVVERDAGPAAAVVVTAISFAVAHVPVYGLRSLPLAICAGLVLGWLRWWSQGLAAPIVVHVAADLAILWL